MRIFALTSFLLLTSFIYGQNDSIAIDIQADSLRSIRITQKVQEQLISQFTAGDFKDFYPVIDLWIDSSGYYESTLRTIIIKELLEKNPIDLAVQDYFDAGYYDIFRNRMLDSKELNYLDYFMDNVLYYGYLPLNDPLDTMLKNRALMIKDSTYLSLDEKLITYLFTGDIDFFELEAIKKEYKKSYVGRYFRAEYRKERDMYIGLLLGTGVHSSFRVDPILGPAQTLFLGISSPLSKKWLFDFMLRFRFAYNPKEYDFLAMEQLNSIKAKTVINFAVYGGYKIVEIPLSPRVKMQVHPKVGLGVDLIATTLIEEISYDEYRSYQPLTMNLSLGFTAIIPVVKTSYIGFGFYYHYIPYHWDTRVKSKFDSNYLSAELFWRL